MTENMKNNNICPGCGRGCSLDNPHCPRGEEYVRTGSFSESHNHAKAHEEHSHHDHRGPHIHHGHGGRGMHPSHSHSSGHKPPHHFHYETMDTPDKILALLNKLNHQSHRIFDGKSAQHHILHMLQKEGSMTQRDITECLGIQPGSASEILKKLEMAGLIFRSPSKNDRRTTDVCLTEAGAERIKEQDIGRNDRKHKLFSALSSDETQQLLSLLEKVSIDWDHQHHHDHPQPRAHRPE